MNDMDGAEVMPSPPISLKVLVYLKGLRSHRGADVQRTLVSIVECISVDGRSLFHPAVSIQAL